MSRRPGVHDLTSGADAKPEHPDRIGPLTLILALACAAVVVAGIVALSTWLTVRGESLPGLPAAADDSAGAPGALVCPATPATQVAASTLIDCGQLFDGRQVVYRGEAIRAVLQRDEYAIVQVNDDPYAASGPLPERRTHLGGNSGMTVVMPLAAGDDIKFLGSYSAQGDLLMVTGTFHRASQLLGGEPAIHAARVEVVRPGHVIPHAVSRKRAATAAALLTAVLLLLTITRRRARQAERPRAAL